MITPVVLMSRLECLNYVGVTDEGCQLWCYLIIIIKMFIESKEKPTTGHVVLVAINIMLVVMSCGFVLGGNSCIGDVLAVQLEWGD